MQPIGPTWHYVIDCHDGRRIDVDAESMWPGTPQRAGRSASREEADERCYFAPPCVKLEALDAAVSGRLRNESVETDYFSSSSARSKLRAVLASSWPRRTLFST
jgi:hypothetical protein